MTFGIGGFFSHGMSYYASERIQGNILGKIHGVAKSESFGWVVGKESSVGEKDLEV